MFMFPKGWTLITVVILWRFIQCQRVGKRWNNYWVLCDDVWSPCLSWLWRLQRWERRRWTGRDLSDEYPASETRDVTSVSQFGPAVGDRVKQSSLTIRAMKKSLSFLVRSSCRQSEVSLKSSGYMHINEGVESHLLTFATVPLQMMPSPMKLLLHVQVRTPGPVMLHLAWSWQPPFFWRRDRDRDEHESESRGNIQLPSPESWFRFFVFL